MSAQHTEDPRVLANPGTKNFHVDLYPFFLLNRAVSRYNAVIEKVLRPLNVDIASWRVLMILGESTPRTISAISESAVINISTMTRVLHRMAKARLIRSAPRPDDNRVTEVFLTRCGEEKLAASRKAVAPIYAAVINGFSREQFIVLVDHLTRLYRNLASLN